MCVCGVVGVLGVVGVAGAQYSGESPGGILPLANMAGRDGDGASRCGGAGSEALSEEAGEGIRELCGCSSVGADFRTSGLSH